MTELRPPSSVLRPDSSVYIYLRKPFKQNISIHVKQPIHNQQIAQEMETEQLSTQQQQSKLDKLEARKRKGRKAVYLWREAHPDVYRALCRKSSHTYYIKHREIVSERRKKEREAARYVAAEQAKLQSQNEMNAH